MEFSMKIKFGLLTLLFSSLLLMSTDSCSEGDNSTPENIDGNGYTNDNNTQEKVIKADYHIWNWKWEPIEKAFKLLLPKNWILEGGIFRIDPSQAGGLANSTEAKLDLSIKKDKQGTVMMRWFPEMYYIDMSRSPAGQMGMFPSGSNNNGMLVMPVMRPEAFVTQMVFPYYNKDAKNIKIVKFENLPDLANAVKKETNLVLDLGFRFYGGMAHVEYSQYGVDYEEKLVTAIVDMGDVGGGMWKNRYTFSVRAPKGQLNKYEATFANIGRSVKLNEKWVVKELKAQVEAGNILLKTQAEINRIGNEITEHRQKTNDIIQNDMYNNLTGNEDYVDPFTNEIVKDEGLWEKRWVGDGGQVIYSDDPLFDPNTINELNHFEYKESKVYTPKLK